LTFLTGDTSHHMEETEAGYTLYTRNNTDIRPRLLRKATLQYYGSCWFLLLLLPWRYSL